MRPTDRALERAEHGIVERDGIVVAFRVVRSARRRRTIELTLEPDGVRIAAPLRTPTSEIAEFVRSRVPWIQKHRSRRTPGVAPAFRTGETLPYLGHRLPLEVVPTAGKHISITMDLLGIRAAVPDAVEDDSRRADLQDALRTWYRARADEVLRDRVAQWSRIAGYGPKRLMVRDQRRRWGSCSPDGTVRLNWRLVMLEPRLVDYVVAHELAHLVKPHHRPSFWAEVERLMPDYRTRRTALREAGATLPL